MLLKLRCLLPCCLLFCLCACSSNNAPGPQPGSVSTTTNTQTTQPASANQTPAMANAPATIPASQPVDATGGIDACSLLDNKEIAKVQGGAIKESKSNQRNDGDFLMSQCFYTAEEFVRSVSLSVVQPNPANTAKQPREYFTERFRQSGEKSGSEREREREREREKAKEQKAKGAGQPERGAEEEEEEGGKAERVSGVGEQAYWVKSGPSASLYVLKNNQFIILSIGGGDPEPIKLRKTKALAQQALKRLK